MTYYRCDICGRDELTAGGVGTLAVDQPRSQQTFGENEPPHGWSFTKHLCGPCGLSLVQWVEQYAPADERTLHEAAV